MTTYATFYAGASNETTSEPITSVQVHEADVWPVHDNSVSGTKDQVDNGLHPVVAVGGRTAADGRPLNITGIVMTVLEGLTEPVDLIQLNIADGTVVVNYVNNTLSYDGANPLTFESAPVIGQPVYVDDSASLGAGCTLSLSQFNVTGTVRNPMAGVLWYNQDEYANASVGGPNTSSDWPLTWAETIYEYAVCILLINGARELVDL